MSKSTKTIWAWLALLIITMGTSMAFAAGDGNTSEAAMTSGSVAASHAPAVGPASRNDHGSSVVKGPSKGHSAAATVKIADKNTMKLLRTDWLHKGEEAVLKDPDVGWSGFFFGSIGMMAFVLVGVVFYFFTGRFKRSGLKFKLYAGFSTMVLLVFAIGGFGFYYMSNVAQMGHLEARSLELDMKTGVISTAQLNFILHGIENKAYGEEQLQVMRNTIAEFSTDVAEIRKISGLEEEDQRDLDRILVDVESYKTEMVELAENYHIIEEDKEELDHLGKQVDDALGSMARHHEELLDKLEAKININVRKELVRQTHLVEKLVEAEILSLKISHAEVEFLLDKNPDFIGEMEHELSELTALLRDIEGNLDEGKEIALMKEVEKEVETYVEKLREIIRAEAVVMKDNSEMLGQMQDIDHLSTAISHRMEKRMDMAETEGDWAVIIVILLATVAGVFFSILVTSLISKPIKSAIDSMGEGSAQVTSASGQVAESSQSLAQGNSEQAASLEEISASMEELSSTILDNTEKAQSAEKLSQEATQFGNEGLQAMERMSSSINDIKSSSDETAKIIKTIDEIAFQTNLLALNAAVEAARAGDAGRGFAVVAEEVRNLALRSAKAAKSTSDLIEESQDKSPGGVKVSEEVSAVLNKINGAIDEVNKNVQEVVVSSTEQSKGVVNINTAMAQIETVTQSNASNAEEGAAASEELSAQASILDEIVTGLAGVVNGADKSNGHLQSTGGEGNGQRHRNSGNGINGGSLQDKIQLNHHPVKTPEMHAWEQSEKEEEEEEKIA